MKHTLPLLVLPFVALASGCVSQGESTDAHWSQRSISSSMGRTFLGYDEGRDGRYLDFQYEQKKGFNTTLRRYFFHHNPDNPFEVYDASYFAPRYPNSIVPDTITYIQEPVSSLIGTFSDGGSEEFADGFVIVGDDVTGKPSKYRTASYLNSSISANPTIPE